jgi:heme a synthase
MTRKKWVQRLSFFAVILAFIVVVLGAYTRITDAGLGCPDWPGCYNQLTVPKTIQDVQLAERLYPNHPVETTKAWAEMTHRYVAFSLGLTILVLAVVSLTRMRERNQPKIVPFVLCALAIFQAALGMWTVTLKLAPIVVMAHLLGGFSILNLLWWLYLRNKSNPKMFTSFSQRGINAKFGVTLGLIFLVSQISLGAWTSANYAALACTDFPYCTSHLFFPQTDFQGAFGSFEKYFILGQLSSGALMTIQMVHRIGAMIVGGYLFILASSLLLKGDVYQRGMGFFTVILLIVQISLGILNVKLLLPIPIAVAHNAVAALLLLCLVSLVHYSFYERGPVRR